ncbi:MAG: NYN domain-containing protein [Nitrospiraceae bacterium]|nr:NYN domain-containing protein [Nitrospiraceae bacterium]
MDGYNLIGLGHGDLQAARTRLISDLAAYRRARGHDITIVFDGWQAGSHREERSTVAGIPVIYSRLGDKADLVIKRLISEDKREWIVITSDREIAAHAWASGSVPVRSEVFQDILEGRRTSFTDEAATGDEEGPKTRRGKAHTPSRKEKSIARVLKKL